MAKGKCFNMYSDYVSIEITLIIIVILVSVYLIYNQNKRLNLKENFTEHLPTLTMYYTNWCGHSKRMLPVYNSLRAQMLGRVDFYKEDCDDTKNGGKQKCMDNGIRFLPTILFRKDDNSDPVKYNGGPDASVLTNFIEQELAK
jgi:thioredoxin-like negative regulator of GroEL